MSFLSSIFSHSFFGSSAPRPPHEETQHAVAPTNLDTTREALSSREKAFYVELVNDQLRAVHIQDQKTFSVFAAALQSVVDSTQKPQSLEPENEGISRCIEDLTQMLNEPEMYAKAEHHEEFRSIIRDRVAAKIKELKLLATDEKTSQAYIEQQQKSKKEAQDHLKIMQAAHEPVSGSEGHVVSEEENVQQQAAFWARQEVESSEDETEEESLSDAELEQITARAAATILSSIWEEERERQNAAEPGHSPTTEPAVSLFIHRALGFMDLFLAVIRLRTGMEELQKRQQNSRR